MNRYPRSVSEAALKCIPCNAPLSETIGGQYVCIECGNVRISRRRRRSFHDDRHGVSVLKEVAVDQDAGLAIGYTIESNRDDGVFVRLVDRSPGAVDAREFAVRPEDEADNWHLSGSTFTYSRHVGGGESIETGLTLSPVTDDVGAFATRPDVEVFVRSVPDRAESDGGRVAGPPGDVNFEAGTTDSNVAIATRAGPAGTTVGSDRTAIASSSTMMVNRGRPAPADPDGPFLRGGSRSDAESEPEETDEEQFVLAATPAYNESETIGEVVTEAGRFVDEVLVVDDGSEDRTAERAARAGATVVKHHRNRGYGATLKTIFAEANRREADCLVILDADGQHDAWEIPKLVDSQRASGGEIVIGSRFVEGSSTRIPPYRRLGLFVVNLLTNLSMGIVRPRSFVSDTQSGFRLYNDQAIEDLARVDGIGNRMDASIDILYFAHKQDYLIEEVGVTVDYDVENPSSQDPLSHGYQLVRTALRAVERERPLLSLGLPGLLLAAFGVVFVFVTLQRYLQTGFLPLDTALLAILGTLSGLFACLTAAVLHALNFHTGT